MAQDRAIVDEAYAGDIIGLFDPGIFSIGDTLCAPGKKFRLKCSGAKVGMGQVLCVSSTSSDLLK